MKYKLFPLLSLLALALAPLNQAKAIVINPESFGQTEAQVSSLEPGSAYSSSG